MTSNKFSNKPKIQLHPYSDEELDLSDEMKIKLEKLIKFFEDHGINYDKFDPESIPKLDFGKRRAYPNNEAYMYIPGQHDTQKWLQAIREIYNREHSGENRVNAIRRVTAGWNIMETFDFLNWVKFYEAGDHMKYKFAQWYVNDDLGPGYFLQIKKDPEPVEKQHVSGPDIDFAKNKAQEDADRRQTIEKQRNKIIGRLDSAEKLLRSPDGHIFSGKEFESLLESIYQLKKKIQMVNKISSSTRLYEDMIVREANILYKHGMHQAANVLYSVAQTPAASGEQAQGEQGGDAALEPSSPGDPSGNGQPGMPGGLPSMGPGMPQGAPPSAAPESVPNEMSPDPDAIQSPALIEFFKKLEGDESDNEDDLEVMDAEDDLLITEAQAVPPVDEPMTTTPAPAPLDPVAAPAPAQAPETVEVPEVTEEPLEVGEEDIQPEGEKAPATTSNFNNKMDAVLSEVTVNDVISELEDLDKIFKTREIPRRLGRVDMMLDSLGLASFFPTLSEATNKSLEANNYISTRIEDILSKLRGTLATQDIDLKGEDNVERPEVAGLKNKLQEDADKEKARKKMRKEQEAAELAGKNKETPEVEIEEDLGAPPAPAPPPAALPRAARPPA